MESTNLFRILHGHGPTEGDKYELNNVLTKIFSLLIILGLTILFGFVPYFWKKCRKSTKILGLANSFSGGIFLGIALFHLLPESAEMVKDYFNPEHDEHDHDHDHRLLAETEKTIWQRMPIPYMCAFLSYSLILFVEKIAFDSHSLIEHEHDHGGHGHHHNEEEIEMKNNLKKSEHKHDEDDDEDSDLEEEALKNVISSKGKFASFLYVRNQNLNNTNPNINPLRSTLETQSIFGPGKKDKVLERSSMILGKALSKSFANAGLPQRDNDDLMFLVNPNKVNIEDNKKVKSTEEVHEHEEFIPKSNLTPYLLLIALSFHGFFEGLALGIQGAVRDSLFLSIAIVSHKWAEAFTLGISFTKANTEKCTFIKLICLFSIFTPLGICIGLLLSNSNELLEGIILAISTGTFLYVAASEVIVEEFSVTKHKYSKFFLYLLGGILIAGLALLEGILE